MISLYYLGYSYCCVIVVFSVSDPLPEIRIRIRLRVRPTNSNFFIFIFFCKRYKTHNDFFVVIYELKIHVQGNSEKCTGVFKFGCRVIIYLSKSCRKSDLISHISIEFTKKINYILFFNFITNINICKGDVASS